ncbi:hypothetical protein F5Y09DRAFT_3460 [Xylaria sp. FL1042]|nr:hypothetical protein F5Y09DRAFT_717 [Xylaria sp. FL1042]KAI0435408.1 hypothetical protein F5Y09DRAFT_3460 [Xylaria sp. FL1042]
MHACRRVMLLVMYISTFNWPFPNPLFLMGYDTRVLPDDRFDIHQTTMMDDELKSGSSSPALPFSHFPTCSSPQSYMSHRAV